MLVQIFETVLKMSLYGLGAGFFAALICLLFRYLPVSRRIGFLLWAVVAVRLICPFAIPVPLGVLDGLVESVMEGGNDRLKIQESQTQEIPSQVVDSGQGGSGQTTSIQIAEGNHVQEESQPVQGSLKSAQPEEGGKEGIPVESWWKAAALIWLLGVLGIWGYGLAAAVQFKKRLRSAVETEDRVYESDKIPSSCIFGLFRPKIYMTPGLEDKQRTYILLHEREHIRHRDHIWKVAAYLIMGLHWFNFLLWGLFQTFQNELERYCDERVIVGAGVEKKEDYCEVLLAMSVQRSGLSFTPLAFGENRGKNDLKDRICQILKYRKPNVKMQAALGGISLILAVGLLCGSGVKGGEILGKKGLALTAETLYSLRNPYVGDASKNGALISGLKDYLPDTEITQELFTDQKPYGLRLYLKGMPDEWGEEAPSQMYKPAVLLLALIENLDEVSIEYEDSWNQYPGLVREWYDVEWVRDQTGLTDIKEYGRSEEGIEELLNILEQERERVEERPVRSLEVRPEKGEEVFWAQGEMLWGQEEDSLHDEKMGGGFLTAAGFLKEFYTVSLSKADEVTDALGKEAEEQVRAAIADKEKEKDEKEEGEGNGHLVVWTSEIVEEMFQSFPYDIMSDDAKNRMLVNRYLLKPYQLAQVERGDLHLLSCSLKETFREQDGARLEYNIELNVDGETKQTYEGTGYLDLVLDGEGKWMITDFTTAVQEK